MFLVGDSLGRRRRGRRIRPRPKRKLPEIFQCPRCGEETVSVSKDKELGVIKVTCSNCGLSYQFEPNPYLHPVDYYSRFIDKFEESATGGLSVESKEVST